MKSLILGMLAETSIHPGAGQSTGFVDLPVAREAASDYPVIVGSSVKGALREKARQDDHEQATTFGTQEQAGQLLISDARLILLPVRSLNGQYKWITCPHLVERLIRDGRRAEGTQFDVNERALKGPRRGSALVNSTTSSLFLEERQFNYSGPIDDDLLELLQPLFAHPSAAKRLPKQLVVLHDDDFVWFARYGLAVTARNTLDEDTKESKNLWYEETISPDSLFYSVLAERRDGVMDNVATWLKSDPYLQVGGNASVGQGWFALALADEGDDQ